MTRHLRRWAAASFIAALPAAGCIPETPDNAIPPPDLSKVIAYYPLDGLVRVRLAPGALPSDIRFIYAAAYPTGTWTNLGVPIRPDGSFTFALSGGASDVIEIAGATDETATVRGAPAFVRVPELRQFGADYICCGVANNRPGKCQEVTVETCELSPAAPDCFSTAECAAYAGQVIQFPDDAVAVTPPDPRGRIKVSLRPNRMPPGVLVRVENRGQRAVGGVDRGRREAAITDEQGVAEFELSARGDDELVFRAYDLAGYRSREHAVYVPDAELAGLDVVGVLPFEPLGQNRAGKVAIRFSPYGIDNVGICPDSGESPALCFSAGRSTEGRFDGGLDFGALTFPTFTVDGVRTKCADGVTDSPCPVRVPGQNTKFTDGDVLAGNQYITLVVDNSSTAADRDTTRCRILAARTFAAAMRARDQVTIYLAGGSAGFEKLIGPTNDRDAVVAAVESLTGQAPTGEPDLFGAIAAAANEMRDQSVRQGSILVLATRHPSGDPGDFTGYDAAYRAVVPENDPLGLQPIFKTHLVALDRPGEFSNELESLPGFSEGQLVKVNSPDQFLTAVSDVTGLISGAFVLLYEVGIPQAGKVARIEIEARLQLTGPDGEPRIATGEFRGDIEIRDGLGPNTCL